ncbi:hypothetical protein [Planctomicrobium sp. SH527]|uniref:hypothetical protein n=1 Tax=Planctomicrobium sp. SH527 TaxID=3448123 RepID=UPI003F5BCE40
MSSRFTALLVVAAMLGFPQSGCQRQNEKASDNVIVELKHQLSEIEKYGEGGSSLDSIRDTFDSLKQSNPATAAKIETDFNAMISSNTSAQRKALARKLHSEL